MTEDGASYLPVSQILVHKLQGYSFNQIFIRLGDEVHDSSCRDESIEDSVPGGLCWEVQNCNSYHEFHERDRHFIVGQKQRLFDQSVSWRSPVVHQFGLVVSLAVMVMLAIVVVVGARLVCLFF